MQTPPPTLQAGGRVFSRSRRRFKPAAESSVGAADASSRRQSLQSVPPTLQAAPVQVSTDRDERRRIAATRIGGRRPRLALRGKPPQETARDERGAFGGAGGPTAVPPALRPLPPTLRARRADRADSERRFAPLGLPRRGQPPCRFARRLSESGSFRVARRRGLPGLRRRVEPFGRLDPENAFCG